MHTIPPRFFATLTPLRFLILLAVVAPAIAATVNTGTLSTSWSGSPAAPVNESTTAPLGLLSASLLFRRKRTLERQHVYDRR